MSIACLNLIIQCLLYCDAQFIAIDRNVIIVQRHILVNYHSCEKFLISHANLSRFTNCERYTRKTGLCYGVVSVNYVHPSALSQFCEKGAFFNNRSLLDFLIATGFKASIINVLTPLSKRSKNLNDWLRRQF